MFHWHSFLHTYNVPPPCESVWEIIKVDFFVCGDHVNTCHNCVWMNKWYMPPKVVYVSLPQKNTQINLSFLYSLWLETKLCLRENW